MSKKQNNLARVNSLKEDLQKLSTEKILARVTNFNTSNEVLIAYKQILKDRGIDDYFDEISK